jgi:3-carboxy-cis,cis-muconate cycloisomerase
VLESLEVDSARMRRNLDLTGGLVMGERIAFLLDRLGRAESQEVVREAATRASASETSFRDALLDDSRAGLDPAELDAALDPSTYLGSAAELVDRALAFYESSRQPNEVDE